MRRILHHNKIFPINRGRILHIDNILPLNNRNIKSHISPNFISDSSSADHSNAKPFQFRHCQLREKGDVGRFAIK